MDQARYFVVTAATGECCEELEYRQREVEQAPDDPEAWLRLGLARQRRNEDLQALDAYDRALALDPTLAQAHHNRGVSLHYLGRWTQAVEAYREALRLDPRYVRAHVGLGIDLCKLGQETEARAARETAIELDPAWYEAHHNLGGLLRNKVSTRWPSSRLRGRPPWSRTRKIRTAGGPHWRSFTSSGRSP